MLDIDAVRATERLISRGFEAYLVGGCVRDLLLGRTPKDYDIATEARPPQVKRVFPRNCRIIGRRFKLAHLHFHGNTKILECSTFRCAPQPGENGADVLITQDNEFGTAEEDALRRDFTVNALFLDPTRDTIYDFADGLQDVRDRVIRTIGDPVVRFREDPVRILRAAKFAGRLGFTVEEHTLAAMAETSGDLVRSAPPRVLEEILRLLRGGHALDSFQLLRDVGALRALAPVLAEFLADASHDERVDFWHTLDALDQRIQNGHQPPNGVLLGALLVGPVLAKAARNPGRSPTSIAEDVLGPLCAALRLPKRDAGCLKRICGVQHRFLQPDDSKRFRIEGFLHSPYFFEALDLFDLRMLGRGQDATDAELDSLDHWRRLADQLDPHHVSDDRGDSADGHSADGDSADGDSANGDSATDGDAPVGGVDGEAPLARYESSDEEGNDAHAPAADEDLAPPTARGHGRGGHRNERRNAARPAPVAPTFGDESVAADGDAVAGSSDHEPVAGAEGNDASNPWHGAPRGAQDGSDGDGRRRRRRRRRRRGGRGAEGEVRDEAGGASDAAPTASTAAAPRAELVEDDGGDAPASVRARPVVDFVHPEGEDEFLDTGIEAEVTRDDGEVEIDVDAEAPREDAGPASDAPRAERPAGEFPAGREGGPGEGRRRRRRRRRGRGRDRDEQFPRSDEPAPHGDAVAPHDAPAGSEPGEQGSFPRDPAAPSPERLPVEGEEEAVLDGATAPESDAGDAPIGGADQEDAGQRRRRRRRGRRGRGRRDEQGQPLPIGEAGQPADAGDDPSITEPGSTEPELAGEAIPPVDGEPSTAEPQAQRPHEQRPHGQRHGQPQRGPQGQHGRHGQRGRDGNHGRGQRGNQGQQGAQGQRGNQGQQGGQGQRGNQGQQGGQGQRGNQGQQGQNQQRQQGQGQQGHGQPGQGQGRRDREERRRDRRQGGPRDVDVVPRHRDRRGKVDVIEPPPLDLSAFDVELDPKRVPTFGSIVEGKGRPKRRSPRVPEDGVDDYKPPPPPGSDAPPPPPPPVNNDSPDTFGDW